MVESPGEAQIALAQQSQQESDREGGERGGRENETGGWAQHSSILSLTGDASKHYSPDMPIYESNGFTFHDMATASTEEVVAHFNQKGKVTPGVGFARKLHCSRRAWPGKDSARSRILNLYSSYKWPMHLTILTMPGLKWLFETQLLHRRGMNESGRMKGPQPPTALTRIIAVENDELIYRGALNYIPRSNDRSITLHGARALSTDLIQRFYAMSIEDYIEDKYCEFFDAAWFDFNGFLTERRLEGIKKFWAHHCGLFLTVTTLAARWTPTLSAQLHRAGGLSKFIQESLPDSKVFDDFSYQDGKVPMHQLTLIKEKPSLSYFGYDPYPMDTIHRLISGSNFNEGVS